MPSLDVFFYISNERYMPFNSLFEMPKVENKNGNTTEEKILSILYLRCNPVDWHHDAVSGENSFQFSI